MYFVPYCNSKWRSQAAGAITHPTGLRSRSRTVLTKNTIEELDRFL